MKTSNEVKQSLAIAVAKKIEATQERVAIKRIPFHERTPEQQRRMLELWGVAGGAKEYVRCVQLAYAIVRGRSYWQQERSVRRPVKDFAGTIAAEAGCETVEAEVWLAAKPPDEAMAAFEEHLTLTREVARRAAQERSRARRAAVAA